jgi:nucleoside-diphosphate-sugar epimerase
VTPTTLPPTQHGFALVTGASGFLGGLLARRLIGSGRRVRVMSRSPMPELEKLGAEVFCGDVADPSSMQKACENIETVFHVAAKVGIWGKREEFERTNIGGARALVDACRTNNVGRIVFTSSPSVVFNDSDFRGADETQPLGTNFPADYPRTKAEAERIILAANTPGSLATVSLRPHLIWGVGDHHLIPRVVGRAKQGRLRIVGEGHNKVDLTHVENVIDAHVLAETALRLADSPARGKAYFITNGEPVDLWSWINDLLDHLDIAPVSKRISLANAKRLGATCETIWRIFGLQSDPPMTRFAASELAKDHWFEIGAARRDLGYSPRVTMREGLDELVPWLRRHFGD